MKILFYNLGYGRGHDGSKTDLRLKAGRFLHQSVSSQKKVLNPILSLIEEEGPDLFAYAEVSTGSFKNRYFDQHQYLVESVESAASHSAVSKYGKSVLNRTPFHIGNSNGIISFCSDKIREHYLKTSRKKLVYEVEMDNLTVLSVHLPLVAKQRRAHLEELAEIVNNREGDVVVCGDFNILKGVDELDFLTHKTSLSLAGEGAATYPAHKPRHQLDVFLYRFGDKSISPKLKTHHMTTSDHLPVVLEW